MESEIGSIVEGKVADLVVFDEDIFAIDPDKVWKLRPITVMMDGQVVQGALPPHQAR